MKKKQQSIGIITQPIGKAGFGPLSNLLDIVCPLSISTHVITGNEGMNLLQKSSQRIHIYGIRRKYRTNIVTKIITHIHMQLKISLKLIRLGKKVDTWIFFLDSHALLLPVIAAKLTRKKIIFALAASLAKSAKAQKDTLANVSVHSESINFKLSNCIILHSPNLIKEWNLEKYRSKIYIAHEYFLDFDKFKIKKKFDDRRNLVGYVGRLSEEKGVLNFVKAIPDILEKRSEIKFLVGGDGYLQNRIEKYLEAENLNHKVKLGGWIPHYKLPDYLNGLKLLVIPSYTESGPIIALEAMSCGTPILATRVGHVLNMVEDGETGFIVENNSPECIAKGVIRALNYPNLDEIVKNARELVEKEFTYEAAVEGYSKILENF